MSLPPSCVALELRSLPCTGITRLPWYCGDRPTAGMAAGRERNCNNIATPTGNTRTARKDGSITGTGSGPTGNGSAAA